MSSPSAGAASPEPADPARKVLFVAGAGRSGTSTMAGLLQILGLHVPQPEVVADETNPKGFGEPQWVVEHHDRLLREANVQVSDARPQAWADTAEVAQRERERARTADWLGAQLTEVPGSELVIKDPRLSWFLPLWRVAAERTSAVPVFVTMLRPPAEVVGSRQRYYRSRLGSAHLAASWLNVLLHTEHATRAHDGAEPGAGRVFVRYADLLDDWAGTTRHVGEALDLRRALHADPEAVAAADRFVDPGLRRVTETIEDLGLPARLRELTAETWQQLNALAEPGGDVPAVHTALDRLREAYVELYEESEAITRSSVVAAEHRVRLAVRAGSTGPAAPPPPSLADRVPHRLRAAVPPRLRRAVRRVLPRPR